MRPQGWEEEGEQELPGGPAQRMVEWCEAGRYTRVRWLWIMPTVLGPVEDH